MDEQRALNRAVIRITDLALRTIIGSDGWERTKKQDIVINISMEVDATAVIESDSLDHTLNYKNVKEAVIDLVESSSFFMLEKLTHRVLEKVMTFPRVLSATVRIDKPHALRFADSVSVEMQARRGE